MLTEHVIPVDRRTLRALVAAALLYSQDHPEAAPQVIKAANPYLALLVDEGSEWVAN